MGPTILSLVVPILEVEEYIIRAIEKDVLYRDVIPKYLGGSLIGGPL